VSGRKSQKRPRFLFGEEGRLVPAPSKVDNFEDLRKSSNNVQRYNLYILRSISSNGAGNVDPGS